MTIPAPTGPADPARFQQDRLEALRTRAQELEAAFLAEMLGHAGLTESGKQGGGQFESFLRAAQAEAIVEKGGFRLAESIFESLVRREGGDDGHAA